MSEQEASSRFPSAPLHWRVPVCRWLWRVLGFVWGTLIVGIIIATIANFNTTTTETPLAKLYIVHLAQTYPLAVWSSLGLLVALTLLSWLGSREKQVTPMRPLSEQDRVYMLCRLRLRYEQLFSQSLQGAVQLELGLVSKPAAVQNAVSLALRVPDQPEHQLPPHTSIVQAYELAQRELLILGEPGAGKSTLLVELARSLVEQAEQDATHPLPILLPLSSWAECKRPLHEWLGEEIARLYDVQRRLSQQWIQAEQVLPLLDGLDEMEEAARPACIAAINTYHREHLLPLVVCSRTDEYDTAAMHERLALHTSVVVQPLSPEQVTAHLASMGRPLVALRTAFKKNPLLQTLSTTPLLLQILILTYRDALVRELPHREAQLRQQIWTDYVQRMVERKGNAGRYPLRITCAWLSWLASEMRQHNQIIFSLERLQPDWLPTKQRAFYRWSSGLVGGLVGGLAVGLSKGLLFGLAGGLLLGLYSEQLFKPGPKIVPTEALAWSWKRLLVGLLVGLSIWLFGRPGRELLFLLSYGLFIGLLVGLNVGFTRKQLTERSMLSPNEGIHRSLKHGLVFVLVSGLVFGPLFGLAGGLLFGLGFGLLLGLLVGSYFGGLGAAVQHYLLRFWLAQSGVFPWGAVLFLEDATARILLRRVGGGYSFAHRLLLDFFADDDATSLVQTPPIPVQVHVTGIANDSRT